MPAAVSHAVWDNPGASERRSDLMSRVLAGMLALAVIAMSCGDDASEESSAIASDPFRIHPILEERADHCAGDGDERGGEHGFEGGCLVLGPPAVSSEEVSGATKESFDGDVVVNITLTSAGADAFDAVAAEHVGSRLAIVVGGEVVNAPVVQAAEYAGAIQVGGISDNDADSLVDALSS